MDLYYWPPTSKWGLPSFDIGSLHVLTYIKFSGADVGLHPVLKSWLRKEGKILPCLTTPDDVLLENPENIIQYLKRHGFDPDEAFDVDIGNNILPFSTLILEKLLPAVLSTIWIDNANFKDVTLCTYARACQYPLNFIIPRKLQKKEEHFVKEFKFLSEDDPKVSEQILSDAKSTLNLLSEFLGEKDYLFGKNPCSLDALLFSIIAPLLRMPLVSSKLQNHLKGCLNLCQYISRILQKFFLQEKPPSQNSAADTSEVTENSDWKYDWLFPVTVATIAMLSYAANAGLLHGSI